MARRAAWLVIIALGASGVPIVIAGLLQPIGDPGTLDEPLYPIGGDIPVPSMVDASGPTVTVVPADGCSPAGAVVLVTTINGSVTLLLGSSSFGAGHAQGVSVGDPFPDSRIAVLWPGIGTIETLMPDGERSTVAVTCTP